MMKNKNTDTDTADVYVPSTESEDAAAQTYHVSSASASASGYDKASKDDEEQYDKGVLAGIGAELQNSYSLDNNNTPSIQMQIPDRDSTQRSFDSSSCSVSSSSANGEGDEEDQYEEDGILLQDSFELDSAKRSLPEDTFSFLIYCDISSRSFILGILVFLFQIGIYIILTLNIVSKRSKGNLFGFPTDVDTALRISECSAILISIITQTDVRKAICLYRDGFDEAGLTKEFKGAKLWKWSFSIGLRATQGVIGLFVAFVLIMRSDDVLELLLNFSAIEFVTVLDDVVFELAREGFFGRRMKKEAKRLMRKTYRVSKENANSRSASRVSILYFLVLFLSFYGGLTAIGLKQKRGVYFCDVISSQFSDEEFPVRQGYYRRQDTTDGSITYKLQNSSQQFENYTLAYCQCECEKEDESECECESDQRWTLSDNVDDPCNGWVATSSKSESGDSMSLFESASFPWLIKDEEELTGSRVSAHFLECFAETGEIKGNMLSMIPAPIIIQPPTPTPTIAPTSNITTTNAPSSSPSRNPTNYTKQPNMSPSSSAKPSFEPISSPSPSLSGAPSISYLPSRESTLTMQPSVSSAPSLKSSSAPSRSPSYQPTMMSSSYPSLPPSKIKPTAQPSSLPSRSSGHPTKQPSSSPSKLTTKPSLLPSTSTQPIFTTTLPSSSSSPSRTRGSKSSK